MRVSETGGAAPPIFLKIDGKVVLNTPNVPRLVPNALETVISTPNILYVQSWKY